MAINGISGVNSSAMISSYTSQRVSSSETTENVVPAANGSGDSSLGVVVSNSGPSDESLGTYAAKTLMQAADTKAMGDAQLIANAAQTSTPNAGNAGKTPDNNQQQVMQLTNNAATAANTAVMQVNVLA